MPRGQFLEPEAEDLQAESAYIDLPMMERMYPLRRMRSLP